jgi:hypothetical protein
MLITHRFGSTETLSRAKYWMEQLGFEVTPPDPDSHDVARLSLNVDLSRAAAVLALIDSIERSDPNGWPAYTTPLKMLRAHERHGAHTCDRGPSSEPIHWHRRDEKAPTDPNACKVCEYMFSRWE